MTTMQEEEKTCSMQFKNCKCQRAVLLSAYEGVGIVVVFMLYSSQKKKIKAKYYNVFFTRYKYTA